MIKCKAFLINFFDLIFDCLHDDTIVLSEVKELLRHFRLPADMKLSDIENSMLVKEILRASSTPEINGTKLNFKEFLQYLTVNSDGEKIVLQGGLKEHPYDWNPDTKKELAKKISENRLAQCFDEENKMSCFPHPPISYIRDVSMNF